MLVELLQSSQYFSGGVPPRRTLSQLPDVPPIPAAPLQYQLQILCGGKGVYIRTRIWQARQDVDGIRRRKISALGAACAGLNWTSRRKLQSAGNIKTQWDLAVRHLGAASPHCNWRHLPQASNIVQLTALANLIGLKMHEWFWNCEDR